MKKIKTKDAAGMILYHDLTQIIKDKVKGPRFKKGHVITEEDIPVLLDMGKEHIYAVEYKEGMLHENDAAEILADACQNTYMSRSEPSEGKIEIIADTEGVFVVDTKRLLTINRIENVMIATRSSLQYVKAGDKLAGTRIIPLIIESEKMSEVSRISDSKTPLLSIKPIVRKRVGLITIGTEVYTRRIEDTFSPVIIHKLRQYHAGVVRHITVPDHRKDVCEAIREMKERGAELILCTGGMSVDPDDVTPSAISDSGAKIITYGAPVLPGAMFMLGYYDAGVPIMGLPGCVMYAKATIFDIVLPRILADIHVSKKDIAILGNGGLCLGCQECHYPNCAFGKGGVN